MEVTSISMVGQGYVGAISRGGDRHRVFSPMNVYGSVFRRWRVVLVDEIPACG
jgi:hypothetical protein